jgi:hypothetical protein
MSVEAISGWHGPGFEAIAFTADFSAGLFQKLRQLLGIGVGAAWNLFATDTGAGAIDNGQAQFAVAILWGPGDALEGFEGVTGNQQSIVKAQRGVHGKSSSARINSITDGGLPVRLDTCTDDLHRGVSHKRFQFFSIYLHISRIYFST